MRIGQSRLIVAAVFALFAWPTPADAQQPAKIPLIAILADESPVLGVSFKPFSQGLQELGYIEGQNIAFERRYAEGNTEVLPSFAAELVRLQPDVIFTVGILAARAAKAATQTIPIVFARTADPIGYGLVPSLARPGGNVTGLSDQMVETGAKRLELLITAVPGTKRVGLFWDSDYPADEVREIEGAARSLSLELAAMDVRDPDNFEPAFRAMAEERVGALIVATAPVFSQRPQQMADLTSRARLPAIFFNKQFVNAGGLMSYGLSPPDKYRRAAVYVDKILKGAKPADLPVEQPTKFELAINLKTAKALGLTIPYTLLGLADEVIE
jgi:putative tryptophan/tyrosine transport system substrate-binding protein